MASAYFAGQMAALRPPLKIALCAFLATWLAVGCRKESSRATWDIDLLAPLVSTTLDIGDLVADSLLSVGPGGAVSLLYRSELFAVDFDTVLQAPDTSFAYRFALPFPGPFNFPAGSDFFTENNVSRFDLSDVALRYLELREGSLELELRNHLPSAVIGTFTLPGATLPTGPAMLTRFVGPGTFETPTIATEITSLAGAVFDLRGPFFNDVNALETSLVAQLDPDGNGATLTDQDSLIAFANYRGLTPQYARGYFGSRTIDVEPAENELGLFDNIVDGTLDLDEVYLRLKVTNGMGADVRIWLDHLRAINTRTGSVVDLTNTIFDGPINLGRAMDNNGGATPTIIQRDLDNDNSNIDQFLENLPDKVAYDLDMELNPLGDISNGNDFIYYDSQLRADLELEVPLRLVANQLTLQTVTRPELPGSSAGHALQQGDLRIFATNGFPFSARLELAIIDTNDVVLTTVPVQGLIASGILGNSGIVQQAVDSRVQASLDPDQVDLLYGDTRLRIRAVFNTADQTQHLQLYDTYRLDLQVTLGANYLVNGDE